MTFEQIENVPQKLVQQGFRLHPSESIWYRWQETDGVKDPQIVNGLGTRSRYYPGRGIQDATADDVIWLARWCDDRLSEIYRQYLSM